MKPQKSPLLREGFELETVRSNINPVSTITTATSASCLSILRESDGLLALQKRNKFINAQTNLPNNCP